MKRVWVWLVVAVMLAPLVMTPARAAPAGRTLLVAVGGTTPSLNPYTVGSTPANAIFLQMFEGLTRVNDKGKLEPALATSWRAVNATTWEFELRSGVQFHSGHPFGADDVKYSIEQVLRPETRAVQRTRIALVTQVTVVSDRTVRVITERPFPLLPAQLPTIFIASKRYADERGEAFLADNPSGTGPFRLVSWRPGGERIELEAFDRYWGGRPQIDRVVFRQIPEGATRASALMAGEVHIANNLPIDLAEVVNRTRGYRVVSGFLGNGLIIAFNIFKEGPHQNSKVREALSYAVDRETILRELLKGHGRILNGQVLTPEAFGYNPALTPVPFDRARAKRLLAESGFASGFSTTLATPIGRYLMDREIAIAVAGQFQEVGVRMTVQAMDLGSFGKGLLEGQFPVFLVGWQNSPQFDADTALQWFQSSSAYKWTGDPATDELLLQARTTVDPERRKALYAQATEQMRTRTFPAVFLFQTKLLYGVSAQVDNFVARPDEYYNFRAIRVR